ncbi:MAG: hypothetical protein QW328_04065 [Nitrososphaerota archaeon]
MKVERKSLGKMLGYVVDIVPSIKWGKLLYAVKLVIADLPDTLIYNIEELPGWLWYGSAVNAYISRVQQGNSVKLVVDDLSQNEYEPSIQSVLVSVLSYDAKTGELVLKKEDGRVLTLTIFEDYIKDELLTASEPNFYALFIEKPSGLRMVGLIRSPKYRLLNRAKELANLFISSSLEHNLCKT